MNEYAVSLRYRDKDATKVYSHKLSISEDRRAQRTLK